MEVAPASTSTRVPLASIFPTRVCPCASRNWISCIALVPAGAEPPETPRVAQSEWGEVYKTSLDLPPNDTAIDISPRGPTPSATPWFQRDRLKPRQLMLVSAIA